MKFSDITRAATGFLRTDQGKKTGNEAIRRAADAANGVTKNKHAEQVAKVRAEAEKRLRDFR
ncbi:antitoxin [Herbiconiux sp. L3-i23]|uniref:antitoxin n=1 Tax=Herbiconiux sp. L3-i23 TaxID=2905871 RepID=UPI0020493058|nr:antitoxin [Herbiconiux sp. L3-i23]BDI23903.1 hypothetical protein L3i23_26790 [Herbiconiux sp. L3-i23]